MGTTYRVVAVYWNALLGSIFPGLPCWAPCWVPYIVRWQKLAGHIPVVCPVVVERVVIYVVWGKDVNVDIYFSHYIHELWLVWMTLIDSEEIASVWRIYLTAAKTGGCWSARLVRMGNRFECCPYRLPLSLLVDFWDWMADSISRDWWSIKVST